MGWKVGDGPPPEEVKERMRKNLKKTLAAKKAAGYKHTWHTGRKPCDARTFADAYNLWIESGMNWKTASEAVGMPRSTFKTWVKKFE